MAVRLKPEIKDGKPEEKAIVENAPCIQKKDLEELKLVLQVTNKKFVTIQVNPDWSARIDIPPGVQLPMDVDLPVLIYRVPRKASGLVGRWHVVGYARAPADAPSP